MGLRQLLLDLPTTCSRQEALYTAAADLHDRGIRGWRNLELRTTDPTSTASIRRFTFTYWHPATVPAAPPNLSYHVLWERMDQPARTALLRLAPATVVTAQIENALDIDVSPIGETKLENEPLPRTCRAQARDDYVDDRIDHPREHPAVIRPTVGGVRFGAHPGYLARESGGVTVTGQLYQPATESCSRRAGGVAACVGFHTWGVPDPGHCDTQPGPRRAPIPPTGVDGPESVSAAATGPAVSAGVVRRHYPLSPARPPARSHPSPDGGQRDDD